MTEISNIKQNDTNTSELPGGRQECERFIETIDEGIAHLLSMRRELEISADGGYDLSSPGSAGASADPDALKCAPGASGENSFPGKADSQSRAPYCGGAEGFAAEDEIITPGASVVFQGVEGAYSHSATLRFFGDGVSCYHVQTFAEAMDEVSAKRADFAVLPIENSSAGQVGDVYDLLLKHENVIIGEVYIPVNHCLLAPPGSSLSRLKRVYSHPQGLLQCAAFLSSHPDWQQISVQNTALAALKVIKEGDLTSAAIASELAASLYGLDILQKQVNDNKNNTTRFIVISNRKIYRKNARRISICFEIAHESGSLYKALSRFIYNGINMSKIESRPIPDRPFEYRFYVDFEGNLSERSVLRALSGIRREVHTLKILGNY